MWNVNQGGGMVLFNGRLRHLLWGVLVLAVLMMASGCGKKSIKSDGLGLGQSGSRASTGTGDGTQAIGPDGGVGEEGLRSDAAGSGQDAMSAAATQARELFISEDLFFMYNSAVLSADAQAILQDKAQWLMANPRIKISIEGHTDERGTVAYNLALGNQRAENTKNFLVKLGIGAGRMRAVSYGEEQPSDPGDDESAWSRNRRVHFEIR